MDIFTALINNLSLLVVLSILYRFISSKWQYDTITHKLFAGLLFGGVAVAGMMNPLRLTHGIIFDGRSIIISIAGLFGGPVTAAITVLMSGAYRSWLGGGGSVMGVSVILESAAIGVAYYYIRRNNPALTKLLHLYCFGIAVHICMIVLMMALPSPVRLNVFKQIALPVILIYPVATVIICRLFLDQEARIATEESLQKSEEKFKMMAENISEGLTMIGPGNAIFINDRTGEITGYPREELLHMKTSDVAAPEYRPLIMETEQKFRETGILPEPLEFEIICKDGSRRFIINRYSGSWRAGKIITRYIITTDITQRKQADQALKESEERFRAIANYTPDWESWVGPDGRLLWVNPSVERLTGYTPQECLAMPDYPLPLIYAGDREALAREFALATGGSYGDNIEFRLTRKDGTMFWGGVSYQPIFDFAGRSLGHRSSVRDITLRKQAEEEGRKLREQLIQSQKMEAIGHLTGGIAHDFNNILSAIIGYANLTELKMKEDDPLRANIQQILSSSERAANLVRSLLAFSRKQLINPKPVRLDEIVLETEKMLQRIIGEDIELQSSLSGRDIVILADSGQISQILINLANNARDAMPGGGTLFISTGVSEIDDGYIAAHGFGVKGSYGLLAITDTGTGMDEKTRSQIFEPFFTTKEVGKGSGLGLSTVYGIVKQHNGFINCYSEKGQGTTFKMYLPLI